MNINTMIENNKILISNNNYLLSNSIIDIELVKSIISNDTSIIYFDENFDIKNPIFELFESKLFDKLIIISKKNNLKFQKRLFVTQSITKRILKHVKQKIFIIIKLNDDYSYVKNVINNLILLNKFSFNMNLQLYSHTKDFNILSYIINNNSKYFFDIVNSFTALSISDQKLKYEYIYDTVCNYLDSEFKNNNLCDFQNNQCIANRQPNAIHSSMGCCYSFEYSNMLDPNLIKNIKLCQHLDCNSCSTKCITCKMFTCKYLRNKGYRFRINNLLLLDCFFNKKQHLIIKYNFFKTRDEIIEKLLEDDHSPYLIYYLNDKYEIK